MLLVKDIMMSPVVTISEETPLGEAVALMHDSCISGLPVVDSQGDLVGLVTEYDVIQAMMPRNTDFLLCDTIETRIEALQSRFYQMAEQPVSSIMAKNVTTIADHETILDAAGVVLVRRFKRVPVTRNGKPVGIVSRVDILKAMLQCSTNGHEEAKAA